MSGKVIGWDKATGLSKTIVTVNPLCWYWPDFQLMVWFYVCGDRIVAERF